MKTLGFCLGSSSGVEEFNLGPMTRLDLLQLLCDKVLLKYKEIDKASDINIRMGRKSSPV